MVIIEEEPDQEIDQDLVEEPTPWTDELPPLPPMPAPRFPPPPAPPTRTTTDHSRSPRREEPAIWSVRTNYPNGFDWLDVEVLYGKRFFTIIERPSKHPGAWTLWWHGPRANDWTWMRFDQFAYGVGIDMNDD